MDLAPMRLRLIDNWRSSWRFWSARLMAVGALIQIVPAEHVLYLWNLLPSAVTNLLPVPHTQAIGAALFVLALIARVLKQDGADA